jgi:hypothetical protein
VRGACVVEVVGELEDPDRGRVVAVVDGRVVDVVGATAPSGDPPAAAVLDLAPAWGWPKSAAKAPTVTTAPPAIQNVTLRTVERPLSRPLRAVIGTECGDRTHEERSGSSRVR